MPKAVWNGVVLAESKKTIKVEGNHYFPPEAVNRDYFVEKDAHTTCWWKGVASYYDVVVDGKVYKSGAWTYPEPSKAAERIRDYVAFYPQVKVE